MADPERLTEEQVMERFRAKGGQPTPPPEPETGRLETNLVPRQCPQCGKRYERRVLGKVVDPPLRLERCNNCKPQPRPAAPEPEPAQPATTSLFDEDEDAG